MVEKAVDKISQEVIEIKEVEAHPLEGF